MPACPTTLAGFTSQRKLSWPAAAAPPQLLTRLQLVLELAREHGLLEQYAAQIKVRLWASTVAVTNRQHMADQWQPGGCNGGRLVGWRASSGRHPRTAL